MPASADQRHHQQSIADIAEEISEPEADGKQAPEGRIAPTLAIGDVKRAADRETGKGRARKRMNPPSGY